MSEILYPTKFVIEPENFINLSLSLVILCDSRDARKIIEETITSIFLGNKMVITPSYHMQRKVAESVMSFGLIENKIMRNVSISIVREMLGGEADADAKIEV